MAQALLTEAGAGAEEEAEALLTEAEAGEQKEQRFWFLCFVF
jgi:hypothetical protein